MSLKDKVETIIKDFLDKRWPFTSLDISNNIKREDDTGTIRHTDVSPIVRQLFVTGLMTQNGYEQTLIDVTLINGEKKKAYLYHHWSTDPDDYTNRTQEAIIPKAMRKNDKLGGADIVNVMTQKINTIPAVLPPIQPTTNIDNTITRIQKDDHRLEIPIAWVGNMYWSYGDTIFAVSQNQKLILKHSDNILINDNIIGTMIVNNDNRLRVTKKVLDKIFTTSGSGNELTISKDKDIIIIEEN